MVSVRKSITIAIALAIGWVAIDLLVRGAAIEDVATTAALVAVVGFVVSLIVR